MKQSSLIIAHSEGTTWMFHNYSERLIEVIALKTKIIDR